MAATLKRHALLGTFGIVVAASSLAAQTARRFEQAPWSGMNAPTGRPEVIVGAGLLAAHNQRLYVFDYRDAQLKAFSTRGELIWSLRGPTPRNAWAGGPTDLKVDERGRIWLLESPQRVAVVDSLGRTVRLIRMEKPAHRIAFSSGNELWALGADPGVLAHRMDSLGNVVGEVSLPAALRDVHHMSREPHAAASDRLGSVAVAFHYSSLFMTFRGVGDPQGLYHGVDSVPFPDVLSWSRGGLRMTRVHPDAVEAALCIDVEDGELYVLVAAPGEDKGRVVDVYSLQDGSYLRSYMLPESASRVARVEGGFAAIAGAEYALRVWRP